MRCELISVPGWQAGRTGRGAAKTTSLAEQSGSEQEEAPVRKASKASTIESLAKTASVEKPAPKQPAVKSRPAPNFGKSRLEPTIMEEDENDENAPEERDSGKRKSKDAPLPAEVEKKKKRKIGAVAPLAPAFDFNGFLVSISASQ